MKTIKEDKIVAIDLSTMDNKKGIVGTAITNSVSESDWDYIYNLGVQDTKKDVLKVIEKFNKKLRYKFRKQMKTIKELEEEEKEALKGCGEKPVDESEGLVLSFNKGTASISQCGNNNEYCPMCSVKISGIIESKKALKDVLKLIDEIIEIFEPHNFTALKDFTKYLKSRIEG